MGYKHMAVVWFSGAIKNRKVAIHHGSKLTRRGPVMDTAKTGRQFRAHTPKTGLDRWLFQTSSDADELAERSALSSISKQTQGEDSEQMDKRIICKGWNKPWATWRKGPAYISGLRFEEVTCDWSNYIWLHETFSSDFIEWTISTAIDDAL